MVRTSGKTNVRKSGYIFEYRFTLLGGARSGKTSIMNRFISDTFTHRYRPTIEDHITHTIDHKGNICVCLLVDTCGGSDFPAMKRLAITKGNAFLLVYTVDSRKSFMEAKQTADEIISLKNPSEDIKIMLIGNKIDLDNNREVYRHEGEKLNDKLNTGNVSSLFFEVSALDGTCINNIFTSLLNMFIPEQNEIVQSTERSAFSRMSFRRRSKKKQRRKQKSFEDLLDDSNYYSDNEFDSHTNKSSSLKLPTKPKLIRSSSATSHSSSESSPSSSPTFSRRENMLRRESSAKDILRKTFGSMHKLFIKPSEHHSQNHNNNNNNHNNSVLSR